MKKFNKKAMSPVVASIILITVTVAVSIAVAAWMGAITITSMGTENIQITAIEFTGNNIIRLTIKNTGTSTVTINEVWVNNVKKSTTNPTLPVSISSNINIQLDISEIWITGSNYQVKLVSSKGNPFYNSAIAP